MPHRIWTAFILAWFPLLGAADGQDIKDYDPLFLSDDLLEVVIEGPFGQITRERSDEEELPAKFRYTGGDETPIEFDVLLRARGNFRRDSATCPFPPIRINFKTSQTDDTLFHKQDKMKLVTHCRNNSRKYVQTVFREYLTYRILNVLTDYSFRVRLLKLEYIYTDRRKTLDTYGFLIEHNDRIGKRISGQPVVVERVAYSTISPAHLNLTEVFQYFIGNTDFSPRAAVPDARCCHNQTLFTNEDGLYRTIPYDFDHSGLVDAPHAVSNPRFKLRNIKQRLYRGRCSALEHLPSSLQRFRDKRSEIEALITNQAELTNSTRRIMLGYVEDFYAIIDDSDKVESRIIEDCI